MILTGCLLEHAAWNSALAAGDGHDLEPFEGSGVLEDGHFASCYLENSPNFACPMHTLMCYTPVVSKVFAALVSLSTS